MKAVVCKKYGSPEVLQLVEAEKPVPGDNEVLVRIEATVVGPPDCAFRKGSPFIYRFFTGLTRPVKTPGDVLSGVIEKTGIMYHCLKQVMKFMDLPDSIWAPMPNT